MKIDESEARQTVPMSSWWMIASGVSTGWTWGGGRIWNLLHKWC